MNKDIRQLEPKALWNNFADLNEIPRPSKKEEKVTAFMKNFGEKLGLYTYIDPVGNVIIKKPGKGSMANAEPIILQSHLDMVVQKNADIDFDFDTQGIKMYVDGDWVHAEGTTLGADNGIGVAAIMTLLASTDIDHPPLEALFTIDEETGMTGAMALESGKLEGKILLNLDSEDDQELTIGCAGGIDVTISNSYQQVQPLDDLVFYKVSVRGLKGGHSGMDIHLGRANANKIMNRILWKASKEFGINVAWVEGGGLRNAIPRESFSVIGVPESDDKAFIEFFEDESADILDEYKTTDVNMEISVKSTDAVAKVMKKDAQDKLLSAIYACPNGIYRLSPDVKDLVQTSNNVARVEVKDGKIQVFCLTRGAVDSEKMDLAFAIESAFSLTGAEVTMTGSYPGWAPDTTAKINDVMINIFEKTFDHKPKVAACHAGLECGIIKNAYPDVDMISFGPNIRGAHSPDERVQVSSVQKFWKLLQGTLVSL